MSEMCMAMTTAGSCGEADRIATGLVEERLAACVNIIANVSSVYRWQGAVERGQEWLLLIKTDSEHLDQAAASVRTSHSYELPEWIVIRQVEGSKEYLAWVTASLRGEGL